MIKKYEYSDIKHFVVDKRKSIASGSFTHAIYGTRVKRSFSLGFNGKTCFCSSELFRIELKEIKPQERYFSGVLVFNGFVLSTVYFDTLILSEIEVKQ